VAEYVKRQNAAEETLVSAFEEYAGLARGIDAELAEFDAAVKVCLKWRRKAARSRGSEGAKP
jgi:hypothetical protein